MTVASVSARFVALAGCLPAADDPPTLDVAIPVPPPPTRDAAQTGARTVHLGRRNPDLAASARAVKPAGVAIDGARVTVTLPWAARQNADVPGFALVAPFRAGVTPTAIEVDGVPCPIPSPCALVDGRLWRPGPAPKELRFEVSPELAAREAAVRGRDEWFGAASPGVYTVPDEAVPVVSLQPTPMRVTVSDALPGSVMEVTATRVPSVLWEDVGPPVPLVVRHAAAEGARVMWSGAIAAGQREFLSIPLDDAARVPFIEHVYAAETTPVHQLGGVTALVGGVLTAPKP